MNIFSIPETVMYKNVEYTILNVLDQGMLLVVETDLFDKGSFPLQPIIIPNEIVA